MQPYLKHCLKTMHGLTQMLRSTKPLGNASQGGGLYLNIIFE